jgi:hypothetical protein
MSRKRGISAIVATVLIVLISIVGVGIIWGVILPIFGEVDYLSYSDVKLDIVTQGYTVYDPQMHFAFVQVSRGNDNKDLAAIEIVFTINGSSVPYRNKDVPAKNEKRTYKFNFTKDGINGTPSSVSIAPVFDLNGQERVGELISAKDIPVQKINLETPQWADANVQAITSIVREDYQAKLDAGNTPQPFENCTINEPCDDGNSCTLGDTRICSGGRLGACIGAAPQEIYNNNADENCDGFANINNCSVLDVPGVSYRLDVDLFGPPSCLELTAGNVTLNLGGHNVSFYGDEYDYDDFEDLAGVTVLGNGDHVFNGGVHGFGRGIYSIANNTEFSHLSLTNNRDGIQIEFSSNVVLNNLSTSFNDNGVSLYKVVSPRISNINSFSNSWGVSLSSTKGGLVKNVNSYNNRYNDFGLGAYDEADCTNVFENIVLSGGIPLNYYNTSVVLENKFYSNLILCNADNSVLRNLTITGGKGVYYGLFSQLVDNSVFDNIRLYNAGYVGLSILGATNNTISNIVARNNSEGIRSDSSYSNFSRLDLDNNSYYGFDLVGGNHIRISDVLASYANYGFQASSVDNLNISNITTNYSRTNGFSYVWVTNSYASGIVSSHNTYNGLVFLWSNNNNVLNNVLSTDNQRGAYFSGGLYRIDNSVLCRNSINDCYNTGSTVSGSGNKFTTSSGCTGVSHTTC